MFCYQQRILQKKLAGSNINMKYFQLQPEYMGQRRIKVTVYNISMQLSGDILAAYLSDYGGIESVTQIKSVRGTAYSNYAFIMCLTRGGFQAIPHTVKYKDQTMMVVVEGRKPLCWECKRLGHFAHSCPQKTTLSTATTTTTTATTTTETMTSKAMEKITIVAQKTSEIETGDYSNKE